jgi:hypothetical protein
MVSAPEELRGRRLKKPMTGFTGFNTVYRMGIPKLILNLVNPAKSCSSCPRFVFDGYSGSRNI